MRLSEKQQIFAINVALLILEAGRRGYGVTFGETYRTPEQAKRNAAAGTGISNSLHTLRLAVDLNLFKGNSYLTSTESHRELGEYWKSLHPDNCWGGDFKKKADGNHYSMEHEGVK